MICHAINEICKYMQYYRTYVFLKSMRKNYIDKNKKLMYSYPVLILFQVHKQWYIMYEII